MSAPLSIGDAVLKNVGKVEAFVHSILDRLIELFLLHPNYITIK